MWPFYLRYPLKSVEEVAAHEYDYIIIGGGTAGCAVASRLSEDRAVSVLLLEKGELSDHWISRIPLASVVNGSYVVRKPIDPEAGKGNRKHHVIAAEALGGNSRNNAMVYTRSVPAYYHRWALLGHPTWNWDTVQPYFSKIEHMQGRESPRGTVHIRQHEPVSRIYGFLKRSAQSLGLTVDVNLDDPSSPAMGYFDLSLTIDSDGYRHSAERAYLPYNVAIERKGSLHICTGATVKRLDLSSDGSVASGVIVQHPRSNPEGEVHIKAKREIILCAGSICTPQILQLSGIGPRDLLQRYGVSLRHELSGVGDSLSDHASFPLFVDVDPDDTLHQLVRNPLQALKQLFLFVIWGAGWLKASLDRAIFLNTAHLDRDTMKVRDNTSLLDSSKVENIPNVEIMIVPVNTRPETYPKNASMTFQIALNQPFSTGTVQINSTDPSAHPTIRLGTLSDARDREVARDALRFSLHLAEHFTAESGYPYASRVFKGPASPGSSQDWRDISDDDLDRYVEENIEPTYHLTGSCRMGRREEGGVVDDELRVHGARNLRIADASVLPIIPCAHPMATVYMVAERCADLVKETWGGR
ncbi:putative choline dehydrogenase [Rosellinia necatrix]|uniref:Putative choline dehydrogenase n=1 Tax=Rosellinia necatrix TaxID=77044 RepID=A0A1S8AA54_ROSNE|nr:putative choline dehydrogenase [Rosellinia necatrix]